jgi:lactoylglutathione lyase
MDFTYTGIRVRDLDRSRRFYREAMGMRVVNRGRMDAGGVFVHLRSPGSAQVLELNWYPPGSRFHEPYAMGSEMDHLAFWCRDARKDFARLVAAGAEVAVDPWDEGEWTLAFVKDPDEIWIELISRRKHRGPPWRGRRRSRD